MATSAPAPEFGTTRWGKDWIRRVEPITITRPNPLLPKGRNLARKDAVTIDLTEPGYISCGVSVNRTTERVSVTIPLYSQAEERAVRDLISADRLIVAGSGDLPNSLHIELGDRELEPLPRKVDAVCTCKARAVPCLHVIAATYAVSLLVDQTPTIALTLRGADLQARPATSGSAIRRWMPIQDVSPAAFFA